MDIYKLKFTKLQEEIVRFLMLFPDRAFNQRRIAQRLGVSMTAVSKSLLALEKDNIITITKDKESGRLSISLNMKNPKITGLKRAENLRMIYESGLATFLEEQFAGATIVLFGSYSRGEDVSSSDIDIAVIGRKEREVDFEEYEKILFRRISLHFYNSLAGININLRENIINGVILSGGIRL
ncbi:MAG: nucleotidyltransferase domain-containing protein [Candidatus Micrarchaeota archaeon]|nr:nucleotidyltransferase domain-containing protein [Candidatus Micrarchaeota archaeon]